MSPARAIDRSRGDGDVRPGVGDRAQHASAQEHAAARVTEPRRLADTLLDGPLIWLCSIKQDAATGIVSPSRPMRPGWSSDHRHGHRTCLRAHALTLRGQAKQARRFRAVPQEPALPYQMTQAVLAAAAGATAASTARGPGRAGKTGRTAGREAAYRDRGQELHRVVMPLRAGAGRRRLGHRTGQLERVSASAAAVLVARHDAYSTRLSAGGYVPQRRPRARSYRSRRWGTARSD